MAFKILLLLTLVGCGVALKCNICSSDVDLYCARLDPENDEWHSEDCPEPDQLCATWVIGEITHRGCKSAAENEENAMFCSTDNCNNFAFPLNRKQCHQCDERGEAGCLQPCAKYIEDEKCYVYVEDETTVYRGCKSDEGYTTNCEGKEFCFEGDPNDQAAIQTPTLSCVQCNQAENEDCYKKTQRQSCGITLFKRPADECFTIQTETRLERGCRTSLSECSLPDCKLCSEDGCNNNLMYVLKCIKCTAADEDCHTNPIKYSVNFISLNDDLQCYFNAMEGKRGGLNELDGAELEKCKTNADECKICNSDNCNDKIEFQTCHECDSTSDPHCATLSGSLPTKTCPNLSDTCYTKIDGIKTIRGCLKAEETCTGELCAKCTESNCNGGMFPTSRKSCHQCSGEDCASVTVGQEVICRNYKPNDKCYTSVEIKETANRGCVSDANYEDDCESKDFCMVGETNNGPSYQTPTLECVQCNQNDDSECHLKVDAEPCEEDILLGRPNDQCYTFQTDTELERGCVLSKKTACNEPGCTVCNDKGCNSHRMFTLKCIKCTNEHEDCHTNPIKYSVNFISLNDDLQCYFNAMEGKRGGLNELDGAELEKCKTNADECKICNSDNCNDKIEFQTCHECDSTSDPHCATLSGSLPTKTCPNLSDTCYTKIDGIKTIRGCLKAEETCTGELCAKCTESNCNGGMFPTSRKSCHQCSGEDCASVTVGQEVICRNYKPNDKCYTSVEIKETANRGCVSDANYEDDCESKDFCIVGETNNGPSYQTPTLECVQCNQNEDSECHLKVDAEPCEEDILLGRPNDQCYTFQTDTELERGCVLSKKTAYNEPGCTVCNDKGCNKETFFASKCISCSSFDNEECKKPSIGQLAVNCISKNDNVACYLDESGGIFERGCLNTLSDVKQNLCKTNTDTCKICDENECNVKPTFQICHKCNSNKDRNCAQLRTDLNETICTNYLDSCFKKVDGEHTIRGCLSECTGSNCVKCVENRCNGGTYPEERLSCYQCKDTPECQQEPKESFPCVKYVPNDECYAVLDSEKKIIRGCQSDDVEELCSGPKCLNCTENHCNNRPAFSDPSLKCIQCGLLDPECKWGFPSNAATPCQGKVELSDVEKCYHRVYDNGVVGRGCTNDINNTCDNDACKICNEDGCNGVNVVKQKCNVCDSRDNASCASANPNGFVQECTKKIQPYETRGCFTLARMISGAARAVVRGCIVDQVDENEKYCEENPTLCHKCSDEGCNNARAPGSGSMVKHSWLLLILTVVYTVLSNK